MFRKVRRAFQAPFTRFACRYIRITLFLRKGWFARRPENELCLMVFAYRPCSRAGQGLHLWTFI
jgi:hypothetical protein